VEKRERPIVHVAKDLGINDTVSRRWMRQAQESSGAGLPPFLGHGRPQDEEQFRLWKKVKALRTANEILKKAAGLRPASSSRRDSLSPKKTHPKDNGIGYGYA
jgi:transposase-like protein